MVALGISILGSRSLLMITYRTNAKDGRCSIEVFANARSGVHGTLSSLETGRTM